MKDNHDNKGHIEYKRVVKEIREKNFFWKGMGNDCLKYVKECPICLRNKAGIEINPQPKKIIPKGPRERYVCDSWKLNNELIKISGYKWVMDVIDYFSKYIISYPLKKNNAENTLECIKEFCIILGYPKIIQTDNGGEYKNTLWSQFCEEKNIKHIFSTPYHPEKNGVIEVSHKEIRKNVMISYANNPFNFNLKISLLNAIDIHNSNIHTTTKFRPNDLIHNTDENIYNIVINNIKNGYKIKDTNAIELKKGDHVV